MKQEIDSVIFDLMGVVLKLSEWKLLRLLGIRKIVQFLVVRRANPVTEAFGLLEQMRCQMPGEFQDEIHYRDRYLPLSLCNWQRGIMSAQDCLERVHEFIEYLDTQKQFTGYLHKRSMYWLVEAFFDPDFIINALVVNDDMIDLIAHCKDRDKQVYLLTNIDRETWRHIITTYSDVIELFDGVVTSHETQLLKPEAEIFDYTLQLYSIQPTTALFIDDQEENVLAAKLLGLQGVTFNRSVDMGALKKRIE